MNRRDLLKSGLTASVTPWATNSLALETIAEREKLFIRKRLADAALDICKKAGASYADVRICRYYQQEIQVNNAIVQPVSNSESTGLGVRVLVNGAWGFIATNQLSIDGIVQAAQKAIEAAKLNAKQQTRVVEWNPRRGIGEKFWQTPIKVDPFNVALNEKIALLESVCRYALSKGAQEVSAKLNLLNEQKYFASLEGSYIDQDLYYIASPFELKMLAGDGKVMQRHGLGTAMGMGYEYLQARPQDKISEPVPRYRFSYDLLEDMRNAIGQLKRKTKSPAVKKDTYDLILDPSIIALITRRGIGKILNADSIVGNDVDAESFSTRNLSGWQGTNLGNNKVGFVADRRQPGGLASTGFDDEGVATKVWPMIRGGQLVELPMSRVHESMFNKASNGCAYADDWKYAPSATIPNISLRPNSEELKLESMISSIDKGLYLLDPGSSLFDRKGRFGQLNAQLCYEIKNGRIIGQRRDVSFDFDESELWQNYLVSAGEEDYQLCGDLMTKASFGASTSHFRNISVQPS